MRKLFCAALLAAFAGCGKADEAVKQMEAIKTAACSCSDAACLTEAKIVERIDKWKVDHKGTKGSQSQRDRAKALLDEAAACAKKLAEGPGEPPPENPAPPDAAPPPPEPAPVDAGVAAPPKKGAKAAKTAPPKPETTTAPGAGAAPSATAVDAGAP